MLIKIYNSKGIEQVELSPNDNSTLVEEIQGDSILALSFIHFDYLELDVDFYTDFEGKRYWLTEKYKPKQNNKKEWVYDVKFYGVESMLKRLLVIKTVDDEEDPVFTLTAPPHEHVAMIVDCMNKGMGNISDWKVGRVDGVANIVIDYFGKYCDEALREIAEKVGGEWWAEGQTVNICKCEHGETVTLGYGNGLLSIDPGTADNVKFYTRLYPVGSNKNIDKEHYGYTRLQLPDGKKFVEINADKYGRVDHYEQDAFSEIYPRRIGTVSSVRSEEVTGEDGSPFTIYYFKDSSLSFDPNDYLLPEKVIRVSFQEGSELGGLGNEDNGTYYFEVNFDSNTREFEIITIWPYGNEMQLPGDLLVPKPGDKYILWNLRMPDEYYALAEQEFLEAVNKYNEDHGLDIAVYKAPTDHVWIELNKIDLSIGRRVRLESDEYFPGIGYRDSRITKITRKVNLPSSMDIEISDALSRTSQQKMSDEITDTRHYVETISQSVSLPDIIRTGDKTMLTDNNLLSALRVVAEITKRALSRLNDDEAKGFIKFLAGLETGYFEEGERGARIDEYGNAELHNLIVRVTSLFGNYDRDDGTGAMIDYDGNADFNDVRIRGNATFGKYDKNLGTGAQIDKNGNADINNLNVRGESVFNENLSSRDFISGFIGGKGWSIMRERILNALGIEEDKYTFEIDNLIVRGILRVYEMIISQLLGENDNRIFTAMLEVDHYDPETGKIWLDTMGGKFYNPFRKDDYIMVQQFNGMPSEENGYYVTKAYELIITDAGLGNMADGENRLDWVTFKNFTSQMEGVTPEKIITKGDTLVRVDSASDPDRKGIIQMMTVGHKTPYMDIIHGLKTDPDDYLKARFGNIQGIRHHLFGWLDGFGAFLTNFYGVGDFRIARTGDSVDTQLEILKTRFQSNYSEIKYEITDEENFLYNPSFIQNMEGWEPMHDEASLISDEADGEFLLNGNFYIGDSRRAALLTYDERLMLFIADSGVIQKNALIIQKMEETDKDLLHSEYDFSKGTASSWNDNMANAIDDSSITQKNTLYLAVKFLALTSGNLTIGFKGSSNDVNSLPNATVPIAVKSSSEWQTLQWEGTWDGKGDFILEFTGQMYVQSLALTTNALQDYKKEIGTQILQTSRNIELLGRNLDAKTGQMTEIGIRMDAAEGNITLWAQRTDANTKDIAQIQIWADKIELRVEKTEGDIVSAFSAITQTASEIRLEVKNVKEQLESSITQTASEIRLEVKNVKDGFESQISQTADKISAMVQDFSSFKGLTEADISGIKNNVKSISDKLDGLDIPADLTDDLNALKKRLDQFYNGETIEAAWSALEQKADSIQASVNSLKYNGTLELWSTILSLTNGTASIYASYVKSDDLVTLVQKAGFLTTTTAASLFATESYVDQKTGAVNSRVTTIEATINGFSATYVKNGNIIAAINGSDEGITISGKKISLEGYTSINGSLSVETNGDINLYGIVRMATDYLEYGVHDSDSNAMFVSIKPYDREITIQLGYDEKQLGKTFKFFNSNPIGGVSHVVNCRDFPLGGGRVNDNYYSIAPQESIEVTCMKTDSNHAQWIVTSRFGYQNWRNSAALGRYPLIYSLGRMNLSVASNNNRTVSLSGYFYDGTPLSTKMSVTRTGVGAYRITFAAGTLPTNYGLLITPWQGYYRDSPTMGILNKATVFEASSTAIEIHTADDDSENDGSFEFMIFDHDNWYSKF